MSIVADRRVAAAAGSTTPDARPQNASPANVAMILLVDGGMVVMQPPGGSAREYQLQQSLHGLRLRGRWASYDLLTMVTEAGWQVTRADEPDRVLLERTGVPVPSLWAAPHVMPAAARPS